MLSQIARFLPFHGWVIFLYVYVHRLCIHAHSRAYSCTHTLAHMCAQTTLSLSILPSVDTWVTSTSWQLWIILLWISGTHFAGGIPRWDSEVQHHIGNEAIFPMGCPHQWLSWARTLRQARSLEMRNSSGTSTWTQWPGHISQNCPVV